MATATREMALSAYRQLLRSTRLAFEGDIPRLLAARSAAREIFEANRGLSRNDTEAVKQIQHAEGVAQVLRENVVQGKAVDSDTSRYKLRIHEHTERGDNESLKMEGSTITGKCGQL